MLAHSHLSSHGYIAYGAVNWGRSTPIVPAIDSGQPLASPTRSQ
jgi:hypothetical protein